MKFSDGGTHHRNKLEAVKCSSICICKQLDLDLFIGERCAPGQSWVNHAERVMSILNIGLQNFSMERKPGADNLETDLKKCNGMDDIRKYGAEHPEFKTAWSESIEETKASMENRGRRLSLKR